MMLVLPTIPSTFSVSTSFLACEAACPGSVCSVSITYSIGRPFTPPLSLTHLKYASAIRGISEKSVPGCFVARAPSLIGSPEAASPGLGPQSDALTVSSTSAAPPPPPSPSPPPSSSSSPQSATTSDRVSASTNSATRRPSWILTRAPPQETVRGQLNPIRRDGSNCLMISFQHEI